MALIKMRGRALDMQMIATTKGGIGSSPSHCEYHSLYTARCHPPHICEGLTIVCHICNGLSALKYSQCELYSSRSFVEIAPPSTCRLFVTAYFYRFTTLSIGCWHSHHGDLLMTVSHTWIKLVVLPGMNEVVHLRALKLVITSFVF